MASPEVHRLAAEAAESDEASGSTFFEMEHDNPLEAIQHYCQSHLAFQRLAYCQGVAAAASAAEYKDCVEQLVPLVEQLTHDSEPEIRNVAVQQLTGVGEVLHHKDAERSLHDIEATLLVCAQQCALDEEEEVAQAAIVAFQQLVRLLPPARATAANKRAIDRLEGKGTDDGVVAAVRLLAHTASSWTQEALQRHAPRYINRWANHKDFSVREAFGVCMSLLTKPMPLQLCQELLMPLCYQLCRDSNWRVRRACSADLPRTAQALLERQQQQHGHDSCSNQQQLKQQQRQEHWAQRRQHTSCGVVDADQPDGACSSKPCRCLHAAGYGSSTGSSLSPQTTGAHTRTRSASVVSVSLRVAASTAEIMTKHPMHSSLITDGLLSGAASPAASATASPTSQDNNLLSQSTQDHHHQQQQAASGSNSNSLSQQQQQQSLCALEQRAPVIHDCWCALRECMELLTADSSHWVKVAALSGLGPFLLLLPGCQVGQLLLGRFTGMAGSTVVIYEISVALACAQHFGPLVVRLGPQRWQEMRGAWHALQVSRDPAVLCELVKALPGLVDALGPTVTVQELLPTLASLLQVHLRWVASQLVDVLPQLLEQLPPSAQDMLLKVLDQLVSAVGERGRAWRLRHGLALQLGRMAAAVGTEAVTNTLWPAAMSLCCDPVAAVRLAAASQVGALLAVLPPSLLHGGEQQNGQGAHINANTSSSSTSRANSPFGLYSKMGSFPSNGVELAVQGRRQGAQYTGSDAATANGMLRAYSSPDTVLTADGLAANSTAAGSSLGRCDGSGFCHTATSAAANGNGYAGISNRGSFDLEFELPCALAPAPAGFSSARLSDSSSSGDDSGHSSSTGGSSSDSDSSNGDSSDDGDSASEECTANGSDECTGGETVQQNDSSLQQNIVSASQQQQQQHTLQQHQHGGYGFAGAAFHPAMMPVGHPVLTPMRSQSTPAPVVNTANSRAKSPPAVDLLASIAVGATHGRHHRHSSTHKVCSRTPSRAASRVNSPQPASSTAGTGQGAPMLPIPACAMPGQYVASLLQHFGCSDSYQQRQLFALLALGLLTDCQDNLSSEQRQQLVGQLQALAQDSVPGVRYAVAAVPEGLLHQAQQTQPAPLQEQGGCTQPASSAERHVEQIPQQQQQQQRRQAPAAAPEPGDEHSPYASYVQELAQLSCGCSRLAALQRGAWAPAAASCSICGAPWTILAQHGHNPLNVQQQQWSPSAAGVIRPVVNGTTSDLACVATAHCAVSPNSLSDQQHSYRLSNVHVTTV